MLNYNVVMIVVYVFVGSLPSYAVTTVHQLRCFYDGDVYFVVSDTESTYAKQLETDYHVTIVPYTTIECVEFKTFTDAFAHRFCYCAGLTGREKLFWYSIERFFLLQNLMFKYSLENVFFAELDNLIYDDPRVWETAFQRHNLNFMFDNTDRYSSGICFVKNADALQTFSDITYSFIEHTDEFVTEMTILSKLAKRYPEQVGILPTHWPADGIPEVASRSFENFGCSIFDAAAIGIFLGGLDPYHSNGIVKLGARSPFSAIDYTSYGFKWEADALGRRVPYIKDDTNQRWLRLNNLHIHSKDLKSYLSM